MTDGLQEPYRAQGVEGVGRAVVPPLTGGLHRICVTTTALPSTAGVGSSRRHAADSIGAWLS